MMSYIKPGTVEMKRRQEMLIMMSWSGGEPVVQTARLGVARLSLWWRLRPAQDTSSWPMIHDYNFLLHNSLVFWIELISFLKFYIFLMQQRHWIFFERLKSRKHEFISGQESVLLTCSRISDTRCAVPRVCSRSGSWLSSSSLCLARPDPHHPVTTVWHSLLHLQQHHGQALCRQIIFMKNIKKKAFQSALSAP